MAEQIDADLRSLVGRLIEGRAERGKVDFKRDLALSTAAEKIEFCKDLSAIANTDDDRLDGHGFIVIGAEPGVLRGGVTAWESGKADNFSASLTDLVKGYVAPVPVFSFVGFDEPGIGKWGVIVIPPSSAQPHIIIKEYSGNPAKHEWFVRLNDTTERAGALDYARVIQRATHRATRPLETELQRLALRLERLEDSGLSSAQLLKALGTATRTLEHEPATSESQRVASLPMLIRQELATPTSRAEDMLAEGALQVRALMIEERPENPQMFPKDDAANLLKPIEYMEAQTRNFAEAIAAITRYDSSLRFSSAVAEAFDVIAEQPELAGQHWQHAEDLRLYPLVLSLFSLAVVSAARNDGTLLRKVLDREFRIERQERQVPLIWSLRAARGAREFFNGAMQQRYFEPIAQRLSTVVPSWCAPLIPGRDAERAFYQAEFALGLEHMRLTTMFHGPGMPLAGAYLYANRGEGAVMSMLTRRSPFLLHLFGEQVEDRLGRFDANVGQIISRESFGRGFSRKTLAAWSGAKDETTGAR
ncbi:MAG TPA: ATP-binding protein [Polyangiaceae bacterium]|nr:ATP-binding protein [Polyangiaceae bacterium]